MAVKNRFNNLTSKEWLPFQKSWFKQESLEDLYRKNLRFFVKSDLETCPPRVLFHGSEERTGTFKSIAKSLDIEVIGMDDIRNSTGDGVETLPIQFALIDTLDFTPFATAKTAAEKKKEAAAFSKKIADLCKEIQAHLIHRRFVSVLASNYYENGFFLPVVWDMSERIAPFLSLKDEKIGCLERSTEAIKSPFFQTSRNIFYSLYFRNDENSGLDYGLHRDSDFYRRNEQEESGLHFENALSNWHIIKPARRTKKEVLHPAKYPEEIVSLFLPYFTEEGANVFDPMSGTASTQLAALMADRNGYGTELSPFFAEIANERLANYINPSQAEMFNEDKSHLSYKILNKDARKIKKTDFPEIDYLITSPPYWDMLNMAGAENQAKRKKKGLQTNYSENESDLGNVSDYRVFLDDLVEIYRDLIDIVKPGGYFTIIVKNIKKKGKNYPFAYDLAHRLQEDLILLPEVFWLQDDISIAPYGYGNTFVSNTFHQYCLNFQKPL